MGKNSCLTLKSGGSKMATIDGHRIMIKDVPANIYKQCGEYYVENNVALKIDKIIEDEKKNNAEIIVINYSEI